MTPPDRIQLSERWFNRIVVGGVLVGFLAVVIAGLSAAREIGRNQEQVAWVDHTYEVERAISSVRVLTERVETARRGWLLSADPLFREIFFRTSAAVLPMLDRVRRLTVDNGRQQLNVALATDLARRQLALARRSVDLVSAGGRAEAAARFRDDGAVAALRDFRATAQRMMDEENMLLAIRNRVQRESVRSFYASLAIAGLLFLLVGAASLWVILRYTRDLSASRDQLRGLNENLEGAVRARTTDLSRANEEIQRFAYIVSHDLRSPLVNVMGFTAELEASTKALAKLVDKVEEAVPDRLDPDARDAARIDLPEAIGFIRTSTQKMDRLINAILRLSREGRRPITPERLDMHALMQGIADTLRHRSDELGAEIAIAPRLPEIVSDRLAVEQIFSNIVENALKYLAKGRAGRITIGGTRDGERAVFAIADNGRGIDPRDHDRIFDLFRRSGAQDQPGEGIGLAHTRALAYRLGGTITVESELGNGATFRVNLPLMFAGEQGSAS